MYILKNAIKNLKRNKSRNIMITAIIFVIVLTSVISMVISNTSSGVIDDYKNKFGAEIFLTPNFEKIREESTGKDGEMTMLAMPELTSEQYIKFAESDYLKKSDINGFTAAGSKTVNAIDKSESDSTQGDNRSAMLGGGTFMSSTSDNSDLKIYGDSWSDFEDGSKTLASGSLPKSQGDVVISSELGKENNLQLGDTIKLQSRLYLELPKDIDPSTLKSDQKITIEGIEYDVQIHGESDVELSRLVEYELKISGFYDDLKPAYESDQMPKIAGLNRRNDMFTTLDTLLEKRENNESGIYVSATYYLNNPDQLEDFETELRAKGLPNTFDVTTDSHSYNAIVKPVEGLKKITTTFIFVVIALGSLVLMLLTSISIGERKYEIGVLRAMGMKKKSVILGLWFEILTMTVICLTIGLSTGALIAQPLSTSLLNSQMVNSQNNDGNLIGSTGSISMGGMINMGGEDQGIKEIDVTLDGKTIIQVVVLSISLTSLAAFISMRKITQYEPIKILMERN